MAVADTIGVNDQSIYQILAGIKLPSGNPKGVGPRLRAKLTAHYPGWIDGVAATHDAGKKATEFQVAIKTSTTDLAAALPAVLARLPGLDDYTAGKVLGAVDAAIKSKAPLDVIERDLLQWLSAPPSKRQAQG